MYVYALVDQPPAGAPPPGLAGQPMAFVPWSAGFAAVTDIERVPAPTTEALRAHDEAVRGLTASVTSVLPARFGSVVADARDLQEVLQRRADALARALVLVRGCEQMTVRVFADALPSRSRRAAPPRRGAGTGGPGSRYLASVRECHEGAHAELLAPLRLGTVALVRAERIEGHDAPPLVASAYHLIERGQASRYRTALQAALAVAPALRALCSGPWPAYAFAPGVPA